MACIDSISELDQILIPGASGYEAHSILELMGFNRHYLQSASGFGLAPVRFLEQRGPFQDGSTPVGMRWDGRTIQIIVNEMLQSRQALFDRRYKLVDYLRPNRAFGTSSVRPLIYRKWLPGGDYFYGTDLETTAASGTVISQNAQFVHAGAQPGVALVIDSGADAGTYLITQVLNDTTVVIVRVGGGVPAATATGIRYHYKRANSYRDLYCLLESGPASDELADGRHWPSGYTEVLRFVAHDPFWYGAQQEVYWQLPTNVGDLIFDGFGAYFGPVHCVGRWLFTESFYSAITNIRYWGHEAALPIIEIDGPANQPEIENTTIGISLVMNYNIAAGETVTINVPAISVTNNFGAELYRYLTGDVALFSLAPDPQAPNRTNQITVSFNSGVVGASQVRMYYQNKYVSL